MEFVLDLAHAAAAARGCPGTAMVQCDLAWLDGSAPGRRSRRGRSSSAQVDAGGRARAGRRWPAPSWSSSSSTTPTRRPGPRLPRPHPGQPVQRRLLDPRHHAGSSRCCATSATRMYAAGLTSSAPRASATSASTRSRFLYAEVVRHRRQPRGLQERRQGDRRPARQGAHLHGEVQRARGQLLPHPPVPARRPTARWCSGTTGDGRDAELFDHFVAGRAGDACATSRCSTRRTSTPTSGSQPARSPRPRSPGAATTAPARCALVGHGAGAADGEPAARRRREPLPGAGRDAGRRPARHRAASSSWSRRSSATPTPPTSRTCRTRCATARDLFAGSRVARAAFGDEVVDHYVNMADVELAAFDAAVTDWERVRGFERM